MNISPTEDAKYGFQSRMNMLAERVGGFAALARKSGLSRRVLDKYRNGESDPSRLRLVALADAADVSLEWLATGVGDIRPGVTRSLGLDEGLMLRVAEIIITAHAEAERPLPPLHLVRLAVGWCADLLAACANDDELAVGLRTMEQRLRRSLMRGGGGAASSGLE